MTKLTTMPVYFVGVDVGTGSARAALVTQDGRIVKTAVESIQTWNPQQDFYEQSSDNIWSACVTCIKVTTPVVNTRTRMSIVESHKGDRSG